MRIRSIKPDFFDDPDTCDLVPLARIAFAGLWCAADREGRMEDEPRKLKTKILPYEECDFNELLQKLHDGGFIARYEIDGNKYIQVINFKEHQRPNSREPKSIIPAMHAHARACTRMHAQVQEEIEIEIEIEGKGNITPPTPLACPEIEYCPETGKVERGRELEAIQEKRAVVSAVQSEIDPMAAMYSQGMETLCEAWKAAKKAKGMPGVVDGKTKEGLALLAGMVERGDLNIDQAQAVVSRFINHPDRNRPDDKWGAMAMAKNFTRFLSPEKGMNRPPGDSSGKWIDAKCPKCGSKSAAFVGKSPKEVVCPNDKCKAKFTVGG